jgi:hypothetical protein
MCILLHVIFLSVESTKSYDTAQEPAQIEMVCKYRMSMFNTLTFTDIEFLIYSSQKTANNTLMDTFNNSGHNSMFCHSANDFVLWKERVMERKRKETKVVWKDLELVNRNNILAKFSEYVEANCKKLKIVSVVRNPLHRYISEFFQIHHDNDICFNKKSPTETIIHMNDVDTICDLIMESLHTTKIIESLWELSEIFEQDIVANLTKQCDHYYYENDYIQLTVLNFEKINDIAYINQCLQLNVESITPSNLTVYKGYINKYKKVKDKLLLNPDYVDAVTKIYTNKNNTIFLNFDNP